MRQIMRGDVIYVDLGQHPNSSIQSGIRPCVVISNNQIFKSNFSLSLYRKSNEEESDNTYPSYYERCKWIFSKELNIIN